MKFNERQFIYGASPEIIKRAAELRKNMTVAENLLWERIGKKQIFGVRFKRQHPISKFIADFYCHSALLVIEIDGEIHLKEEIAERDEGRDHEMKKLGLKVMRFTNDDIYNNIDEVITQIKQELSNPS
ncbi:MAG TPA: endonuclease domain-containing protein [Bacteroidia bacterium]|jgi:very-short-patch-repair endonuclease|nr:endonuclease domain-containing protein [Bacteroidia bacterium]